MTSYEARLATFADGRRLLRLRHPVKNRDAVACDACGSSEPRLLHVLKDEASGQYCFTGSNCLQALAELGLIRRRYAPDVAEHAYDQELARRHTEHGMLVSPPDVQADATSPPVSPEAGATSSVLVAAVAMLHPGEWATLLRALPLGADRWRFIAVGESTSRIADLLEVGVNRFDLSG